MDCDSRLCSACCIRHIQPSDGFMASTGMQRDSLIARSEVERITRLQDDVFLKGCIPRWIAITGYVIFAALAIIVIPFLYTPVKWYALCSDRHLTLQALCSDRHLTVQLYYRIGGSLAGTGGHSCPVLLFASQGLVHAMASFCQPGHPRYPVL